MILAATVLSGCSSDGAGDWSAMGETIRQSWEARSADVPLEQASAIPYATIGIRIGSGGAEQIMILATDANGTRLWTSSARVAVTTQQGRILATAGFAFNRTTSVVAPDTPEAWAHPRKVNWLADFADIGAYSINIACQDEPLGSETINILGQDLTTLHVQESCHSDALKWDFTNDYWVDPENGRMWRTVQFVHPNGEALQIQILRPPERP